MFSAAALFLFLRHTHTVTEMMMMNAVIVSTTSGTLTPTTIENVVPLDRSVGIAGEDGITSLDLVPVSVSLCTGI